MSNRPSSHKDKISEYYITIYDIWAQLFVKTLSRLSLFCQELVGVVVGWKGCVGGVCLGRVLLWCIWLLPLNN